MACCMLKLKLVLGFPFYEENKIYSKVPIIKWCNFIPHLVLIVLVNNISITVTVLVLLHHYMCQ